jgi:hypothetical protein
MEFSPSLHPKEKFTMKTSLSLSIPTPCQEKWDNFTAVSNGRFCDSCSKVVIDFTKMNDQEILDFLKSKPTHACGRFRPNQLKIYSQTQTPIVKVNPGLALLKASLLSVLMMLISKPSSAQTMGTKLQTEMVQHPVSHFDTQTMTGEERVIKGVVKSKEDGYPLPGVNIVLKGSQTGTVTNADGEFEFPEKLKEGDVLIFTFIGLVPEEYRVPAEDRKIEILLMYLEQDIMGGLSIDHAYTEKPGIKGWWSRLKARL